MNTRFHAGTDDSATFSELLHVCTEQQTVLEMMNTTMVCEVVLI